MKTKIFLIVIVLATLSGAQNDSTYTRAGKNVFGIGGFFSTGGYNVSYTLDGEPHEDEIRNGEFFINSRGGMMISDNWLVGMQFLIDVNMNITEDELEPNEVEHIKESTFAYFGPLVRYYITFGEIPWDIFVEGTAGLGIIRDVNEVDRKGKDNDFPKHVQNSYGFTLGGGIGGAFYPLDVFSIDMTISGVWGILSGTYKIEEENDTETDIEVHLNDIQYSIGFHYFF